MWRNTPSSKKNQPLTEYKMTITLPRPMWQLKEELELLESQRPPNHDSQALSDWSAKCEGLRLWVDYGESQYGEWVKK